MDNTKRDDLTEPSGEHFTHLDTVFLMWLRTDDGLEYVPMSGVRFCNPISRGWYGVLDQKCQTNVESLLNINA